MVLASTRKLKTIPLISYVLSVPPIVLKGLKKIDCRTYLGLKGINVKISTKPEEKANNKD